MRQSLMNLEKDGEAIEFVMGRPPRFVRFTIYLIAGLIVAGVLWAYFSTIDIVITSRGAVRPLGDSVKVQPVVSGRILEVRKKEGDSVIAGETLFVVDGKEIQSELDKALARLSSSEKQRDALRDSRKTLLDQQQGEVERDQMSLKFAEGELEKAKRNQEQSAVSLQDAESRLQDAQLEFDRTKKLVQEKILPEIESQKKELALKSAQAAKDIAATNLRIAQQEVSLSEQNRSIRAKQLQISSDERKRALTELDSRLQTLDEEIHAMGFEVQRLRTALGQLEIKASTNGTMASMVFKNAGEVVQAGMTLASVIPEGVPWIVEAIVTNQDAGPLRKAIGNRVKLKIDAFPFRDYGTIEGKLLEVAPDAMVNEKLGSVFPIRVSLDTLQVKKNRREGKIQLGMTVTAEIIKEEERVLMLLFREVRDRVTPE